MAFNVITGISVGADLSRTSPIYRPSVGVPIIRIIFCKSIIVLSSPISKKSNETFFILHILSSLLLVRIGKPS